MPDHGFGYRSEHGYLEGGGGPVLPEPIDWERFDRKVDRLTKDELRYALKKEARLRADTEARHNEVL